MKFKEYLDKHYFKDPDRPLSKIYLFLFLFHTIILIIMFVWLLSMASFTQVLINKIDYESSKCVNLISYNETYVEFMDNLDITVPSIYYVYFAISLFLWFFWLDYIIILFNRFRRSKNGNSFV